MILKTEKEIDRLKDQILTGFNTENEFRVSIFENDKMAFEILERWKGATDKERIFDGYTFPILRIIQVRTDLIKQEDLIPSKEIAKNSRENASKNKNLCFLDL